MEATTLLAGALVVLTAVLLGIWMVTTPGCSVDADHHDGVLATRILAGAWIALEVLLAALVTMWFVRTPDTSWRRVAVAVVLPAGAVALWSASAAFLDLVLDGLAAGPGSASCW